MDLGNVSTDLDYLVKLGYPKYLAICCLKATKGDRKAALLLLRKDGEISDGDKSWRGENDDDWINYVATSQLPTTAESRALWKSPIYVRIGSYKKHYMEGTERVKDVNFQVTVVLKDKRTWVVPRTYSDFRSFYYSVPLGSFNKLTKPFPLPVFFFQSSDAFFEKRRQTLEEWMQQLVYSEECMSNPSILSKLYSFLDAEAHGGAVSPANPHSVLTSESIPFNIQYTVGAHTKNWPLLNLKKTALPITINNLKTLLPLKIDALEILPPLPPPSPTSDHTYRKHLDKDTSDAQLSKDFGRDRIVLMGRRVLGSQTPIPRLMQQMYLSIKHVMLATPSLGESVSLRDFDFEHQDPGLKLFLHLTNQGDSNDENVGKKIILEGEGEGKGEGEKEELLTGEVHPQGKVEVEKLMFENERKKIQNENEKKLMEEDTGKPLSLSASSLSPSPSPSPTLSTPSLSPLEVPFQQHIAFESFLKGLLRGISRTESAYLSHSALMSLIDLSPSSYTPPPLPSPPLPPSPSSSVPFPLPSKSSSLLFPSSSTPPVPTSPPPSPSAPSSTATPQSTLPPPPPPPPPPPSPTPTPTATPLSSPISSISSFFMPSPSKSKEVEGVFEGDEEEGEGEGEGEGDAPFLIVPESVLAEPIEISFTIKEKGNESMGGGGGGGGGSGSGEWCLVVECQTSTVFRVINAFSMQTVLQLAVTFRSRSFGMPIFAPHPHPSHPSSSSSSSSPARPLSLSKSSSLLFPSSSPPTVPTLPPSPSAPSSTPQSSVVVGFEFRKGKTFFCLDKQTKTTSRDLK